MTGPTGDVPHRPAPRTLWLAAAAVVGVVTVAAGWWLVQRDGEADASNEAAGPGSTAAVVRETLADTRTFSGTLGHGAASTVTGATQGVVTGIAEQGSEVDLGSELFRVDERPVTAFFGAIPMYRDLAVGDGGVDVLQLEYNLAALGYDGFTVDEEYTAATADAVRRWQADLGVPETGSVGRGDVVFVPQGSRVDALRARVGEGLSPGAPVLDVTGSEQVVSLDLHVRDRELLPVDAEVVVTLPDGVEAEGTVTSASAVPLDTGGDDPGGGGGAAEDTMIAVEVTLAEPVDTALLGAGADVIVEVDERVDVLTVPVNALVATAGGGHAVEVVGPDGRTELVPVETGLFAAGRVEVAGDGIAEGLDVVVAGR